MLKFKTLLEEMITSMKIVNYRNEIIWIPIFLLTDMNYKEDIAKSLRHNWEARFLADLDTKEVYVFSSEGLHEDAIRKLGIENHSVIRGYAYDAKNGKLWSDEVAIKAKSWITKFISYRSTI